MRVVFPDRVMRILLRVVVGMVLWVRGWVIWVLVLVLPFLRQFSPVLWMALVGVFAGVERAMVTLS